MSENLYYWYNDGDGSYSEIPPQAIPSNKKTDKWKEATIDALENIGLRQLNDNLKFKDFYRMVEGKMSYQELSEVMPQLREVEQALGDIDLPTFLKHYDLIGIIVNAMVGEYMQYADKFNVVNTDEIGTNEYIRKKEELLGRYISEEFEKELNLRLLRYGINPNVDELDIQDPQQREQYIQYLQQKRQEYTPPEIEKYVNSKWKSTAVKWGEITLDNDRYRFYLDDLDRENLKDFLLTGRMFRHYRLGYDYYKPENWSPLNTFFSQDIETKNIEDGDYVGRIHFFTPDQIINRLGEKLTARQKELILGNKWNKYFGDSDTHSVKQIFNENFGETHIVPHKQYYDWELLVGLQDTLGLPLATRTYKDKMGNDIEIPAYLPRQNSRINANIYIPKILREDLDIRTDLLQVTEVYWVSYKRIGYLTYRDVESGLLVQEIVTDDILTEFLKENDIKQVKTVTLEEVEKEPKENTIVWDYQREIWKGIKISGGRLEKPLYIDINPLEFQIKGDSNLFYTKLPVVGYVGQPLSVKLQPFQVLYNVVMNQTYSLLEKEIGLFFIFDIQFLPSEFKEFGDTEDTLLHLRNIVKDVGLFPVDTDKQNLRGGGAFNQFAAQNLTFSGQLADRMQLAEFFKNKAFEQIGFNPQRLGTPVKYETATGIIESKNASFSQTEVWFNQFGSFKKRALEMHLTVAQYAQSNNKDITVYYTKSDATKAFLKFSDPYFPLRQFGIHLVSNSKKRKELETFKMMLLQNNTMGSDELALARLFSSDSMVELMEMARQERLNREKQEAIKHQRTMAELEKQAELQDKKEYTKWAREEYSKQKDRENRIDVKRVDALGRSADNNGEVAYLDYINKSADLALKREKNEKDISLKEAKIENDKKMSEEKMNLLKQKLSLEVNKIEAMLQKSNNDKYIAEINKN